MTNPLARYLDPLPLIAVLRGITPEEIPVVGAALVAHGFAILEVPLNSPRPFDSIGALASQFGERCLVGAGTVTSVDEVTRVNAAGGRLIVMPHADTAVIREAKRQRMVCLPGVATPTEAFAALAAGADGLKMFPAEQLPPPVLKAWRAVLPDGTLLFPVGGINPDKLAAYWEAGAGGFGTGSSLYKPGATMLDVSAAAAAFVAAARRLPVPASINLRHTTRRSNMAAKDRMAVLSAMMEQGVIPVFYHPDVEVCRKVIQACANGGAKCIEFTNRGDFASHVFYEVTRHFAEADPSVIMGVGSIVDAPTAGIYLANGARFVVGPVLNPDVAKVCNRRKIPYSPGCGSASEIGFAEELGCEIVKVFPGSSVGGPDFVKSVLGPCPWTRIMPTGGVEPTEESLRKWFGAGIVAAGIGSNLITKVLLDANDYAGIEKRVAETVQLIKRIRAELAAKK